MVSVIIPCYNYAHFLPETLQSVLDQTYPHWECIIVNDGSKDNTHEVALEWVNKDNRFKYVEKKNGGLSSARNIGLDKSQGDFIQFLDADDLIQKKKFEIQLNTFNKYNEADIVYSNFRFFNEKFPTGFKENYIVEIPIDPVESFLYWWGVKRFIIPIHCALFKTKLFDNFRFNLNLNAREDWVMWVQFSLNKYNFKFIPLDLAYYRKHKDSMVHNENHITENFFKALFIIHNLLPTNERSRFAEIYSQIFTNIIEVKNEIISQNKTMNKNLFERILKNIKFKSKLF